MNRFQKIAIAATAVTFALIGVGGLVRASGSGAGCGTSWPFCQGVDAFSYHAIIEQSHRLFALASVILVGVLAYQAFRHYRRVRPIFRGSVAAAVLVVAQAALGGVVVKGDLHAGLVTAHFATAMLLAAVLVYVTVGAFLPEVGGRGSRRTSGFAVLTAAAVVATFALQIMLGAALVWSKLAPAAKVAHVVVSSLTWGSLVALATASRRLVGAVRDSESVQREASRHASIRQTTAAYFQLTKPRIVLLLLITTVPTMVLAAGRFPNAWLVVSTLFGGTLAAAGANAMNQFFDRDIDEIMRRTRSRPLPAHRIVPENALTFGYVLGVVSFLWLGMLVNVLAAALALSALLFYVIVYTLVLKRTTAQNIVIGGAAGAVPVLVGWAAVRGSLALAPLVLFAVVFTWTPPHFWALSMRYRSDYQAAGIPMLPVVRGERATTWNILLYSVILVAVTLALFPVARMGAIYLATAVGLGAVFVVKAARLWRHTSPALAWSLFRYSINYLGLLFAAVMLDRLVHVMA